MNADSLIKAGKRTVQMELEALAELDSRIDDAFVSACELIQKCQGRVVVTGMGKSGHIGRKIAATLASTGTPAFFVHPGEASHGDLGMITAQDLVLAISYSGSSMEIMALLPLLKRQAIPIVSMTAQPQSPLGRSSDAILDIAVSCEACPLGLAPTSSTSVTLVMGDALAVALLEARGFTAEDFAFSHPGGALGRKLLLKVADVMHHGSEIPRVSPATSVPRALSEMTSKGFGMTTIMSDTNELLGIFTDGDLRRCLDAGVDIASVTIDEVMTRQPRTVLQNTLAAEALNIMETRKITALVVEDERGCPMGLLHMHDLLRAGLV